MNFSQLIHSDDRKLSRLILVLVISLLFTACDQFPTDPRGSLQAAESNGLKVGIIAAGGSASEHVSELELNLVNGFAAHLDTEVQWTRGSESHLLRILQEGELHLVVGGITQNNPWSKHLGMSMPYYTEQVVVCSTTASPVPDDLEGVAVTVRRGSWHIADLKQQGAHPVPRETLSEHRGLVAGDMNDIDDIGCTSPMRRLTKHNHVIAIPRGENGLLRSLEEYLREQGY